MWMYSKKDVQYIVEEFLSEHFNFGDIYLNEDSVKKLKKICSGYGIEVENIEEQ